MDKITMAWVYLFVASVFEAAWAIGLKYAEGFTKLAPSIFTLVTVTLSFIFLSMAVKQLPVGTAYTIWTGIGAATVATYGILVLGEPATAMRLVSLVLIISGVLGLKLFSPIS